MACGCNDTTVVPACSDCVPCTDAACTDTINAKCIVLEDAYPNIGSTESQGLPEVFQLVNDMLVDYMYTEIITIPTASVQTLFSLPYTIVNAAGTNTFINVLNISARISGGTVPYVVDSGSIVFRFLGNVQNSWVIDTALLTQTNSNLIEQCQKSITTAPNIPVNAKLELLSTAVDPSSGNGSLVIYIQYTKQTI